MRSALLYTLLALFATAAQGAQTGLCTRLLQARYQVLQHEEAQLLKLFNASVFEDPSAELTVLSSRGVFAVVDPQTQMKYVIRFPGPFSDTQFEELLAEAAKRAPGVETVL
ncbi:MAG: hypothetical protein ACXVBW_09490, partial [Bdellovibrionota bacterium]